MFLMITKYIIGDITETELKYIAHGVNCQNVMKSGVAKALFTKYPEVKIQYHDFCKLVPSPAAKLGLAVPVEGNFNKRIYNCFTQLDYGYDGKKYVDYFAVATAFNNIRKDQLDSPVAIPKIGCGLAGGNWTFMEQLINDTVGDDLEIWVYELEQPKSSKRNDLA